MTHQNQELLDKSRLKKDLGGIRLKKGDRLIIHSSLKSVGPVEGGADTLLELLTLIKKALYQKEDFLLCPAGTCPVCDQRRKPGKQPV